MKQGQGEVSRDAGIKINIFMHFFNSKLMLRESRMGLGMYVWGRKSA